MFYETYADALHAADQQNRTDPDTTERFRSRVRWSWLTSHPHGVSGWTVVRSFQTYRDAR